MRLFFSPLSVILSMTKGGTMFIFTIIIILAVFALDITLSTLNYNNRNQPIPENVSDVYNKEDYQKWHEYTMEVFRINILSKITSTVLLILFLISGLFPKLAEISETLSINSILQILIFFGLYMVITYVLGLGFNLYRTFNIEERYGFNKTTVKTFILDQIKATVMIIIIGGGLVSLLLFLYESLGVKSLFYAWFILIFIMLAINILYAKVFIKIFNKITPLKEGELYDKAITLSKSLGYEIKQISIMDASKRSSRLNAFFSGFGKFKSIVLYDTLIEKCSTDEIISVLAHEIGHSIHKDTLRNFVISIAQMGLLMLILSYFLISEVFSTAFGFADIHIGFSIILFGILLEPLSILLGIPMSAMSRKAEYKADKCAADAGYKTAMISALKILSRENFSNLTPHPLVVKLTYSHPPTNQRIDKIENN